MAGHFLAKQRRLSDVRLDPDGLAICRTGHHGWPGDVREPRMIELAAVDVAETRTLDAKSLNTQTGHGRGEDLKTVLRYNDLVPIERMLRHLGGTRTRGVKRLRISTQALWQGLEGLFGTAGTAVGATVWSG